MHLSYIWPNLLNPTMIISKLLFTRVFRFFSYTVLITSFTLSSCSKKDEVTPATPVIPTPPPPPENPLPAFSDGNGSLISIKSRTYQKVPGGVIHTDLGLAVAMFYTDPASGNFIEAGQVDCNGKDLTLQTNSSYVYEPDKKDQTGIDYSNDIVKWSISGDGPIPTINQSSSVVFPDVSQITSSKTIDKTKNYRLSADRAWDCDSVLFMLGGIVHVEGPSTNASTFTVKEMSSLKAGTNYVQITGYNYNLQFHDSKGFYFVKETVVTEQVTIQ